MIKFTSQARFGRNAILSFGLVGIASAASQMCFAADPRCSAIYDKLGAEEKAAENRVARERAAIADLHPPRELEEMREKYMAGRLSPETYNAERRKWDQGLACINAEAELKYWRLGYDKEVAYKEAGCQREPITKHKVEAVNERTKWKSEACGKADLEYLAGMIKRLSEIKTDKAANEEPQTPVVKQADPSARNTEFCKMLRSVADNAPSAFKAITGQRVDKKFADKIAISEMVGVDTFSTPVALSLDFLGTSAKCTINIGNEHEPNLALRSAPNYDCTWDYDQRVGPASR
ncbi:hypothetical protein [Bradyrhizobium vignae]|uniref:hypothetical protein n=1 Tax=Bradyrhizobium vignae TaxID=1549949 RepID=UPI00100BF264|nr:hypothetical protein [Bradyrhizobium vignae]RXG91323.1 hypothetical protein EAV90_28350 [Bradyrhizobium vignae]